MIHELRIYHAMPGRLPDLMSRFEKITLRLWEKHGIKQVGFWTVGIGDSNQDLIYMLEWASLADREARWSAFAADPEWLEARRQTEANGPLLSSLSNSILQPTKFSALR
jgi:hypothetical protein